MTNPALKPPSQDRGIYLGRDESSYPPRTMGYKENRHILTFGASGSGKSTSLLIPNIATLKRSLIIIDPKGQLAAITAPFRAKLGKVQILNPFNLYVDERPYLKSTGWNPLLQLDRSTPDFPSDARTLAQAVTDRSGDGKNSFFEDSMENLWTVYCMWERMHNGRAASLRNVRAAFAKTDAVDTLKKMSESNIYAISVVAGETYSRLTDKHSQSTSVRDVVATIIKNTAFLDDDRIHDDMQKGEAINFRKMHDEITTLYVILPVDQIHKQSKWLRTFVNVAISEFAKGAPPAPKLPRVLLMLDEFGNLGRLPEMQNALNILRDYRVQLWMCLQTLEQLRGQSYKQEWTSFFSGAGAINFFGAHDPETAKMLSEMVGDHEVTTTSRSMSGGNPMTGFLDHRKVQIAESTATSVYKLLPPEDTRRLGAGVTVNFIEPAKKPLLLRTPGYWELIRPGILASDPYHQT